MRGAGGNIDTRFEPLEFPALRSDLASSGLFNAVFEECEAGIFILDLDLDRMALCIADANPTALSWLGQARSALVGRNFLTLVDGGQAQESLRRLGQAVVRRENVRLRLALRGADHAAVLGMLSLRAIGCDVRHPRMVAIFRRESESLHEALIAAQRERDAARAVRQRILARMSHELRTPLNGILGFAELIGATPEDQADVRRYRDYALDISAAGRELMMRVEDLLAAAETTSGENRTALEAVAAGAVLERAVRAAVAVAERRRQNLKLRIAPGLPRLRADTRDLARLFDALIDFAVRGAPRGSTIDIAMERTPHGGLVIRVDDDGEVLPLAAVETATLSTDDGRNVMVSDEARSCAGLPMVKAIAERHGGSFCLGPAPEASRSRCAVFFAAECLCQ